MPTTTRAPPATVPTATAATGRTQLRGSRRASSSSSENSSAQLDSSAAACSVIAVSVVSTRLARSSGGSIGRRASLNSASRRAWLSSVTGSLPFHLLLELLDGAVQEHLGRAIGPAERPGDLPVRHVEREAHDQRVAAIVGEAVEPVQHQAQLLAPLHDLLGAVWVGRRLDGIERGLGTARSVAVVVRGEVVGDPDQPRTQRSAVRLAPRPLEVPIGLKKGLLGDVLRVVMVADPVVRVRVDVAQMGAVELLEGAVELRLRGRLG